LLRKARPSNQTIANPEKQQQTCVTAVFFRVPHPSFLRVGLSLIVTLSLLLVVIPSERSDEGPLFVSVFVFAFNAPR
jgi:hypothetical protein